MIYPFENDTEKIEKRIAERSVSSEKNRTFLIESTKPPAMLGRIV